MAERDWLQPQTPIEPAGTAWHGRPEKHFELRPLSLGELLDRTFALYRSRFWLFAGIAMVAAAVNVIGQAIALSAIQTMAHAIGTAPRNNPAAVVASLRALRGVTGVAYLIDLVLFLVMAITQAATALALLDVYQRRSISVKEAVQRVLPRWSRWIGILLWQLGSMIWIPGLGLLIALGLFLAGTKGGNLALTVIGGVLLAVATLGGFPAGVVLYLRNALAIPAAVAEGLTARAAMRRSKLLSVGAKGRAFVVLLIAGCLLEVVGILQSPISFLLMFAPNQQHYFARAISLLVSFAGFTVVAPVAMLGLTLVYFDQRVRKEALDLELLLEGARAGSTAHGEAVPAEVMGRYGA